MGIFVICWTSDKNHKHGKGEEYMQNHNTDDQIVMGVLLREYRQTHGALGGRVNDAAATALSRYLSSLSRMITRYDPKSRKVGEILGWAGKS
jgi:hypothetical protein